MTFFRASLDVSLDSNYFPLRLVALRQGHMSVAVTLINAGFFVAGS